MKLKYLSAALAVFTSLIGSAASQERHALLIGINDYRARSLVPLRGCVNDVEAITRLLQSRFGFTEENVVTLLDQEATRAAMLSELRQLARRSRPGDLVVFHYSGHGSQVVDASGDEEDNDGLDETLVPCDGRTGDVPDITDDELDQCLSALKGREVVVILDSCHSGTGTRKQGRQVISRDAPRDTRALYGVRARGTTVSDRNWLELTATTPQQEALDGPVDGIYHGLFSKALLNTLSRVPARAPARELMERISAEYSRIVAGLSCSHRASTPSLRGPAERLEAPVFPSHGRALPRLDWLPTRGNGKSILLVGAARRKVAVGSRWSVFGFGETQFVPGRAIATGTVTKLRGDNAVLRLERMPKGRASFDDCRAVCCALAPSTGSEAQVRIAFGGMKQDVVAAALRRAAPGVRVIGPRDLDTPVRHVVTREGGEFLLSTVDESKPIVRSTDPESIARIVARSATASVLQRIDNPASALSIRAWLPRNRGTQEERVRERKVGVTATGARSTGYVVHDDRRNTQHNCLQLEVEAQQDCYLTIVNVDEVGEITLLFPNAQADPDFLADGLVEAFDTVRIPDAVPPTSREGNEAGFVWPFEDPGDETIRVFATEDLETATLIREFVTSAAQAQEEGQFETLESILDEMQQALSIVGSRSLGVRGVKKTKVRRRPQPTEAAADSKAESSLDDDDQTESQDIEDESAGSVVGDWTAATITIRVKEN